MVFLTLNPWFVTCSCGGHIAADESNKKSASPKIYYYFIKKKRDRENGTGEKELKFISYLPQVDAMIETSSKGFEVIESRSFSLDSLDIFLLSLPKLDVNPKASVKLLLLSLERRLQPNGDFFSSEILSSELEDFLSSSLNNEIL